MGLWLAIGGNEPVTWHRGVSTDPAAGLVSLREGWNLVAWAGGEGAPFNQALDTLDGSLEGAWTWDAEAALLLPGDDSHQLSRGDAVWLSMSSERLWLQPASEVELPSPPTALGLDPFYAKYVDAGGIPVVSSADVPDAALVRVAQMAIEMLAKRPDLRQAIASLGSHVAVLGVEEEIGDIPEFGSILERLPDWSVLDGRPVAGLRAVGATLRNPVTVAAEENALCYAADTYREDTFVHEMAHTVFRLALEGQGGRSELRGRLEAGLAKALDRGSWANTYAASNADEYWAVAVQAWFDVGGSLNGVDTRLDLQVYDPDLAGSVAEVFGDSSLSSSCHIDAYDETPIKPHLITGKVLGPDRLPLAGVGVWTWTGADWQSFARTDASGEFVLRASDGTFNVQVVVFLDTSGIRTFRGWYSADGVAEHLGGAASVQVGGEDVTGIVISLPPPKPYVIAGKVLGSDGLPLAGVQVWTRTGAEWQSFAGTDANGEFALPVRDGTFKVAVLLDPSGDRTPAGWYSPDGPAEHLLGAASIQVDGEDVTGIVISLPPPKPYVIAGKVLGPDGLPLAGIALWGYSGDSFQGGSTTNANGTFAFHTTDGEINIAFCTNRGGEVVLGGWYGGASGLTLQREEAMQIVVDGESVTGIEISLTADHGLGGC